MNKIVAIINQNRTDEYVIKYRNIFTGNCWFGVKKRLGAREKFFVNYISAVAETDTGSVWYRKSEV